MLVLHTYNTFVTTQFLLKGQKNLVPMRPLFGGSTVYIAAVLTTGLGDLLRSLTLSYSNRCDDQLSL